MRTKNVMILGITAVILIAILVYAGTTMIQPSDTNNTTNDTSVNITLNNTNNTTEDNTTQTTTQKTTKKSNTQTSTKSNSPSVVDEEVLYNYQVDDGSYYREVKYSDGSFKQYDLSGNEIGPGDMS